MSQEKNISDKSGHVQHVPSMSGNVVEFIVDTLSKDQYDLIVEYGTGNSSIFLMKKVQKFDYPITFLSVEMNPNWYINTLNSIKQVFAEVIEDEKFVQLPWSDEKMDRFFDTNKSDDNWDYPESMKRLPMFQNILNSFIMKDKANHVEGFPKYYFSSQRPYDASFYGRISKKISFIYLLKTEMLNDQFGESPVKQEYIDAGLRWPVIERLKNNKHPLKVAFIVDGGPRKHIIDTILDIENKYKHFIPTILVHDGHRLNYTSTFLRRPKGFFVQGSNIMLNGNLVREEVKNVNLIDDSIDSWITCGKIGMQPSEFCSKELWFYKKDENIDIKHQHQDFMDKANWLFQEKLYKEALFFYNAICQNDPDNNDILLMKGICEYETGNIDAAKKIADLLKENLSNSFRLKQFLSKLDN